MGRQGSEDLAKRVDHESSPTLSTSIRAQEERTNAPLWDAAREPPNLLFPGDEVAVVPSRALIPSHLSGEGSPAQERGGSFAVFAAQDGEDAIH